MFIEALKYIGGLGAAATFFIWIYEKQDTQKVGYVLTGIALFFILLVVWAVGSNVVDWFTS